MRDLQAVVTSLATCEFSVGQHAVIAGTIEGEVLICLPAGPAEGDRYVVAGRVQALRGPVLTLQGAAFDKFGFPYVAAAGKAPYAVGFSLAAALGSVCELPSSKTLRRGAHAKRAGKRGRDADAAGRVEAREAHAVAGSSSLSSSRHCNAPSVDSNLLVEMQGHALPVTVLALEFLRRPTVVSASFDATVRVWDPATGGCLRVISLAPSRPATSLAFDESGLQLDGFFAGSVGGVCWVDLAAKSRPGANALSLSSTVGAVSDDHDDDGPVYSVTSLQMGTHAGEWQSAQVRTLSWCSAEARVSAVFTNPNASTQLTWHPCDAFTDPCAAEPSANLTQQLATLPPLVDRIGGSRGTMSWPPPHVVAAGRDADDAELLLAGAQGETAAAEEGPADDELRLLLAERDELRGMCADLLRQRKALRREQRVNQ
jgi:hypothetical protein